MPLRQPVRSNQGPTSPDGSPRDRRRRRPWPPVLRLSDRVFGGDERMVCLWPRGGSVRQLSSWWRASWRLAFVGRLKTMPPACAVGRSGSSESVDTSGRERGQSLRQRKSPSGYDPRLVSRPSVARDDVCLYRRESIRRWTNRSSDPSKMFLNVGRGIGSGNLLLSWSQHVRQSPNTC